VKAHWQNHVIAQSDEVTELAGYRYFPRSAVRMEYLAPASRTASDLHCPHGVQFYDLSDGTHTSRRAAWSYKCRSRLYSRRSVDRLLGTWADRRRGCARRSALQWAYRT
jgi:uncharacterized protein (DUF427 family)